ncbi:hypothetical protein TNCV_3020591 [Trichonephila clavipes]|nr:hypothetical protein TNCV_3020591 [Trichonephila clavipes]
MRNRYAPSSGCCRVTWNPRCLPSGNKSKAKRECNNVKNALEKNIDNVEEKINSVEEKLVLKVLEKREREIAVVEEKITVVEEKIEKKVREEMERIKVEVEERIKDQVDDRIEGMAEILTLYHSEWKILRRNF